MKITKNFRRNKKCRQLIINFAAAALYLANRGNERPMKALGASPAVSNPLHPHFKCTYFDTDGVSCEVFMGIRDSLTVNLEDLNKIIPNAQANAIALIILKIFIYVVSWRCS